jgi:hypothetical protein
MDVMTAPVEKSYQAGDTILARAERFLGKAVSQQAVSDRYKGAGLVGM